MSKSWKHKILPAVVAGTVIFSFGISAQADSNKKGNGKAAVKFKDIQDGFWAKNTIERMADYQIIKGYTDSTFRPNKPVTQLEAISMVMNALEQKEDLDSDGHDIIGNSIPSWAKEQIELALDNGIVSSEDIKNYNKPATRMFVVNLVVNALGEDDLEELLKDNLYFNDIDDLDEEERGHLSLALKYSLIQGYPDKTFKPNKPVTRGEMAVFVSRLFDQLDEDDFDYDFDDRRIIRGIISSVDPDGDELTIGSKTYDVSADVEIEMDGDSVTLSDLTKNMEVYAILEDDEISTIYVYGDKADNKIEFTIEKDSDGEDDFEEAVIKGDKISDSTPDLEDGNLTISLNGSSDRVIDLEEIDGSQDDGDGVAEELENAIAKALNEDDRVEVTFDKDTNRFIFETDNSSENTVPSIQFDGDQAVLKALGLDNSIEKGSLGSEDSWKIIVESDATDDQTYEIELNVEWDDEEIEEVVEVDVDENDTAEEVAEKIANALEDNDNISSVLDIAVDDEEVLLTHNEDDDVEVEIEITEK